MENLSLFRIFVFFFFSIIDIQFVSAKLGHFKKQVRNDLIELPDRCLSFRQIPCTVHFEKRKSFKWDLKGFSISFNKGGVVFYSRRNEVHVIGGDFLIDAKEKVRVLTHFGEVSLAQGLGFLKVQEKQVIAVNITAQRFLLKHLGEHQPISLPKAYQMWISGFRDELRSKKKLSPVFGVPRPAHFEQIVNDWTYLVEDPDHQFLKNLKLFSHSWRIALEEASHWHQKIAQTQTLSFLPNQINRTPSSSQVRIRKGKKKNCFLIRLFMKKNYLNFVDTRLPKHCRDLSFK